LGPANRAPRIDRVHGSERAVGPTLGALQAEGISDPVAAIVGFAARQTLANFVAGVMLAITQPIRVGDWITFEGHYGVVEDVRDFIEQAHQRGIRVERSCTCGAVLPGTVVGMRRWSSRRRRPNGRSRPCAR
jgi:hypothetical protein